MSQAENVASAWRMAADDLGLEVVAPYILRSGDREYRFIVLIKSFGSGNGALVCLPQQWDDEGFAEVAGAAGFYCSGLYSESYSRYDRPHFIDTLNDWGWFGNEPNTPEWYTGKPWT